MTDHLEQAAAKAVELATRLCDLDSPRAVGTTDIEAAAHLTYLAGLIRGGAVHRGGDVYEGGWFTWPPPGASEDTAEEPSVAVPMSDEKSKARIEIDGDGSMRAHDRSGEPVRFQWGSWRDQFDEDPPAATGSNSISADADLRRQRDQARSQRDELLAAVREYLDVHAEAPYTDHLRDVIERIEAER